jgi:hypothetical protein
VESYHHSRRVTDKESEIRGGMNLSSFLGGDPKRK